MCRSQLLSALFHDHFHQQLILIKARYAGFDTTIHHNYFHARAQVLPCSIFVWHVTARHTLLEPNPDEVEDSEDSALSQRLPKSTTLLHLTIYMSLSILSPTSLHPRQHHRATPCSPLNTRGPSTTTPGAAAYILTQSIASCAWTDLALQQESPAHHAASASDTFAATSSAVDDSLDTQSNNSIHHVNTAIGRSSS